LPDKSGDCLTVRRLENKISYNLNCLAAHS
jgi:hypothetical protein